jgi:PAS domain-containing protein
MVPTLKQQPDCPTSVENPKADPFPLAEAVLRAAPEAVLVLEPDGRIAGANPAAERMLDYPATGLVGKSLAELVILPSRSERNIEGLTPYLNAAQDARLVLLC